MRQVLLLVAPLRRRFGLWMLLLCLGSVLPMGIHAQGPQLLSPEQGRFVDSLLDQLTLEQKVGQLVMRMPDDAGRQPEFRDKIKRGEIGAVLNVVEPEALVEMQATALDFAPHGIPLVFARDVIHGFRTIFPLPIGQAASFDPDLVEEGARHSAREAASIGLRWTFAPMIDVSRDPRWGRIAESFGEDPVLTARLGQAAIRGYQEHGDSILMAACAKHFAGYGASEGGRDYNSAHVSQDALYNIHLPPFRAAVEQGVLTFMPSFSDLNGIPPSASTALFRDILRRQWGFQGAVVSDWSSIDQLVTHGVARSTGHAAALAIRAGIDQDMMSRAYPDSLLALARAGVVPEEWIHQAARNVLALKVALNLFENPFARTEQQLLDPESLALARRMVHSSTVMLQNRDQLLPLEPASLKKVAVIGPLADDGYEQLGTWVFDGNPDDSRTPLQSLRQRLGADRIQYVKALANSRDRSTMAFGEAIKAAAQSDVALLFLGEEAILHGEAHSLAAIRLLGAQEDLLRAVAATGTPVVVVVTAGRPLVLDHLLDQADAWLYAWAPGTMGGPGLTDLLLGDAAPSGHLPVTFPRHEGQIPIYHAHRNTGKPASAESWVKLEDIPERAFQTSLGNTSHYLDVGYQPTFPFGFGLTYTSFELDSIALEQDRFALIADPEASPSEAASSVQSPMLAALSGEAPGQGFRVNPRDSIALEAWVRNTGPRDGETVLQLYLSDPVSSVARPVRQLLDFQRVRVPVGKSARVRFRVPLHALEYVYPEGPRVEPGAYRIWVGFDARASEAVDLRVAQP
jgi:beta-glucosidase